MVDSFIYFQSIYLPNLDEEKKIDFQNFRIFVGSKLLLYWGYEILIRGTHSMWIMIYKDRCLVYFFSFLLSFFITFTNSFAGE